MFLKLLSSNFLTIMIWMLLGFFPCSGLAEWSMSAPPAGFCVQNFNLYGPAYATETQWRTEQVGYELLGKSACDIVHLQEVWSMSQISQIKGLLGTEYQISDPNSHARIGLMSLLQSSVEDSKTYKFRLNSDGGFMDDVRDLIDAEKAFHTIVSEPRALGEKFYFVNTHLHQGSQELRLTQLLDLLMWRLAHQDLKMVLSGDFNSDPGSLEHDLALNVLAAQDATKESWGGAYPPQICTYCRDNPRSWLPSNHVFDYVYFSDTGTAATSLQVQSAVINLTGNGRKTYSDHYGVQVNFLIKQGRRSLSNDQYEVRKEAAFVSLNRSEALLKSAGRKDFAPYIAYIQDLKLQLASGQGDFARYLSW